MWLCVPVLLHFVGVKGLLCVLYFMWLYILLWLCDVGAVLLCTITSLAVKSEWIKLNFLRHIFFYISVLSHCFFIDNKKVLIQKSMK